MIYHLIINLVSNLNSTSKNKLISRIDSWDPGEFLYIFANNTKIFTKDYSSYKDSNNCGNPSTTLTWFDHIEQINISVNHNHPNVILFLGSTNN